MKKILSIQSHVAYGYVGNRAAVFPLQRLGYDVLTVNTVQFSNHTGYGSWTGQIFTPEHIRSIIEGISDRGVLDQVDAVLSGYLGDAALGSVVFDTVTRIRQTRPDLIYCCDPVMGDVGRGFFVKPDIPDLFRDQALEHASILTPNQFEITALTGVEVITLKDARKACDMLHKRGVGIVLLTSLHTAQTPEGTVQMLASSRDGRQCLITTPLLPLDPAPNGSGDLTAALFLAHCLEGAPLQEALEKTAASVYAVFEETQKQGGRELAIIPAQDALVAAPRRFTAQDV